MNIPLIHGALGLGLAIAAPALAADSTADRSWFVETSVVAVESSNGKAPFTFAGDETGISVHGGYAFTKHLALQAGYYDLGEHRATDCPAPVCTAVPHGDLADITALSIAALGTWRVAPRLDVLGKVGVLGWRTDFARAGFDDTDRGAVVGAGLGIWVAPNWRVNVQYERADFDLESAGVGVSYRF